MPSFLLPAGLLTHALSSPAARSALGHFTFTRAVLLACFMVHYFHRAFLYPLLVQRGGKPTPLLVWLTALVFCTYNGFMQACPAAAAAAYFAVLSEHALPPVQTCPSVWPGRMAPPVRGCLCSAARVCRSSAAGLPCVLKARQRTRTCPGSLCRLTSPWRVTGYVLAACLPQRPARGRTVLAGPGCMGPGLGHQPALRCRAARAEETGRDRCGCALACYALTWRELWCMCELLRSRWGHTPALHCRAAEREGSGETGAVAPTRARLLV